MRGTPVRPSLGGPRQGTPHFRASRAGLGKSFRGLSVVLSPDGFRMRTGFERTISRLPAGFWGASHPTSEASCSRVPNCHLTGKALLFACLFAVCWAWTASSVAEAQSWVFRPSYFSHAPQGERVAQFQPEPAIASPFAPNYLVSGYRHTRSTIRGAESYDHLHVVRTWGLGEFLRPYEEWEFPFRPGATPYGPWGNPQGPWTLPFDSWRNPFGLGRLPGLPWWLWPRW